MPVTRNEKIAGGIFAGVLGVVALTGAFVASDDGSPPADEIAATAVDGPAFEATFADSADFYDRFDYGYSGQDSWAHPGGITTYHGDHDSSCAGPTTARDITLSGRGTNAQLGGIFWHCAPGGPDTGHVMTGVNTTGYNIAWFSPKPTFSNVSKVCWDVNLTAMSLRKWTQVLFVSEADAHRYPAGQIGFFGWWTTRGSGGFDMGYANPDFQDPAGPSTLLVPQGGTLAGFKSANGTTSWWQDQNRWTVQNFFPSFNAGTDKATRYNHCLENVAPNTVRLTQATPAGSRIVNMPGQIPQHPVRVVFEDDNYNPPKDSFYNPNFLTWHWDNVQVFTGGQAPPATTTTTPATTSTTTTTIAATTSTSTTQPTPTSSTSSTVPGSSTTLAATVEVPRASLEALLVSLNQLVAAIQALLEGG